MPVNSVMEDEKTEGSVNIKIIVRLLKYLKPYKIEVVKTLCLMGVIIAAGLLNPYFLKLGIDKFIQEKDIKGIILLGLIMTLVNIAAIICTKYRIRIMSKVSNEILVTIRQQLYTHLQKLSFSFFDSRPAGKILARIIGDVNSLSDLFTSSITNFIPESITLISVMAIMLAMNFKLALVSFASLPLMFVAIFWLKTVSRKRWQVYRKKNSNMNAFTHEAFSGIRVIQGFSAEKSTERAFGILLKEHLNSFISAVKVGDLFWPVVELSWGIGMLLVFSYSMVLLKSGTISVGLFVAFTGYISMFWSPIRNISNFYNQLITNMASAERIFEILDTKPDIEDKINSVELPPIKGEVEFRNVTFGYNENQIVLKDVSFTVKPGETIALVGPTGVGKTTIVNLISRFYDAQKGSVLIDGHDVKDVTIESLREQMGIMTQDTFLFSGSIKDNIRYGRLDATDEEIIEAAKAVRAHEFIMKLPKGYDTNVNERGSRLSAGQRQLIALARALLASPRILILDEATASIDTQTERLVQEGLRKLLKGRTSFIIAHRLSTIQSADRILVIDGGGIAEMGNHDELMSKRGLYYNLFMAQFKFIECS